MTLTHLNKGYYSAEVPEGAIDWKISGTNYLCFKEPYYNDSRKTYEWQAYPPRLEGNWEIIGTVTKDEISFDVEGVAESNNNGFKNYERIPNEFSPSFDSKEQSFRSLLSSKGVYFENPYGKIEPVMSMCADLEHCKEERAKWQSAQQKVISKAVIIKKNHDRITNGKKHTAKSE